MQPYLGLWLAWSAWSRELDEWWSWGRVDYLVQIADHDGFCGGIE